MLRRLLPAIAVPMATLSLMAASTAETPAGADESTCAMVTDDAGTCRVQAWISCDTAVANKVNFYTPATANAALTIDAPTGSAEEGEFCGEPENSAASGAAVDNIHVFTFEGMVEGNIRDLTVNLYDLAFAAQRAGGDITLSVRMTINEKSPTGTAAGGATGDIASPVAFPVVVTPQDGNQGVTQQYTFTLKDLDALLGEKLMSAGFKSKGAHHVKITIDSPANGAHIWAWGATEIPSGIILNPSADDELGTIVEFEAQG